jgi:ArsR family metal-binding transcriptional regulator
MALLLKDFSAKKKKPLVFEFSPSKPHALEFEPIIEKLNQKSIILLVQTSDLIAARILEKKVHLFRSGKIIIEGTKTQANAKKILEKFLAIIN